MACCLDFDWIWKMFRWRRFLAVFLKRFFMWPNDSISLLNETPPTLWFGRGPSFLTQIDIAHVALLHKNIGVLNHFSPYLASIIFQVLFESCSSSIFESSVNFYLIIDEWVDKRFSWKKNPLQIAALIFILYYINVVVLVRKCTTILQRTVHTFFSKVWIEPFECISTLKPTFELTGGARET